MWNFFRRKRVKEFDIVNICDLYYPMYKGKYLFKLSSIYILEDSRSKHWVHCGTDTESEALEILTEFKNQL